MSRLDDRLARAKAYLAIAESKDSKREAYKQAAKEIVAYRDETGVSETRIAEEIGRSSTYVHALRRWYDAGATGLPFSRDVQGVELATAKRMLRDPASRKQVLESLDDEATSGLVSDIVKGIERQGEQARRTRRAVREELYENPDLAHWRLFLLVMAKIDHELQRAVSTTNDMTRRARTRERMHKRVDVTAELLDTLRLAIDGADDVDWDAEFSRLTGAAERFKGGE